MMEKPKSVFISYSRKDTEFAFRAANELNKIRGGVHLIVHVDYKMIGPGTHISEAITEGMRGSDYYLPLISENSNQSEWVKREISLAFDLSMKKQLTLVPMLLENVEVPLEFRGLLYIDARQSFDQGLKKLVDFFTSQIEPASTFDKLRPRGILPSCADTLGGLALGDLRFLLTTRLTLENVKVLWFDIFNARMDDEVSVQSLAQCCVELIDRSRREELVPNLITMLCRNHPRLPKFTPTQQ
jgi:hypothetical protein